MNQRENESYFTTLLLFVLVLLMLIAGAGVVGLFFYRSAFGRKQDAIRMEMMAREAAMVAQEQERLAKGAMDQMEQLEKVQKDDEPSPQP